MLTKERIFEITRDTTVAAIRNFAVARMNREANFQILDLIMPKEREIRSIVGGLETSLGTRLWEPLAKSLAEENGFTVLDGREILAPNNIPVDLATIFNDVLHDREYTGGTYDAETTKTTIQNAWRSIDEPHTSFVKPPPGHGVDVWIEKEGDNYLFDTKTVQPNVGGYIRFLRQIINWYIYFYAKNPDGTVEARVVFPYNPFSPSDFWENTPNSAKPMYPGAEAWVQDDFWDLCTGRDNSYIVIENAFRHIGEENLVSEEIEMLFGN